MHCKVQTRKSIEVNVTVHAFDILNSITKNHSIKQIQCSELIVFLFRTSSHPRPNIATSLFGESTGSVDRSGQIGFVLPVPLLLLDEDVAPLVGDRFLRKFILVSFFVVLI